MKLEDGLRILRTRWIIVVASFILVTGAAMAAALLTPPTYAASATLYVTVPMGDGRGIADAYEAGLFSHQRVASYIELLWSEKVARRTIKALNLNMTPQDLAAEVTASTKPDTVLIDLSVTDRSATQAAQIANELSSQFIQMIAELEKPSSSQQPFTRIVVAQSATVPDHHVAPRRKLYVGLGMVLGALLGFGLAVLRDYLDKTVKTPSQVEDLTGATVLGLIPDVGKRSGDRVLLPNADAITLEAYRTLRTNVRFLAGESSPRSFVMTSPGSNEGTTSVAANMAYVLAKADKSVALLEGNFRSPSLSKCLRLDGTRGHTKKDRHVGLSDIVAHRSQLEWSVQQSQLDGVAVITAGTPPEHPSELLGSVDAQVALKQFQTRFDYVVIDAPPVLPFTDATLLAKETNGAILVVRVGKTKRDEVAAAAAKLTAVNARLLGVVVITGDYRKLSATGVGNTQSSEQRHVNGFPHGRQPTLSYPQPVSDN